MMIFFFLLFLLLPFSAEATTYWASPSGGAGSCAAASGTSDPGVYRTFYQGISCLASGDTLNLKPGTYPTGQSPYSYRNSSPSVCDLSSNPCPPNGISNTQHTIIQAQPGFERQVVLSCNGCDLVLEFRGFVRWITIRGIKFDASTVLHRGVEANCAGPNFDCVTPTPPPGWDSPAVSGGPFASPYEILLENNEITGAWQSGIHGFHKTTIRGNHVHHNGQLCGTSSDDHGIYAGGDFNIIENNVIHNNSCYGIQIRRGSGVPFQNNIIRGNLIYDNTSAGVVTEFGPHLVYNNVVFSTGNAGPCGSAGTPHTCGGTRGVNGLQISDSFQIGVYNNTMWNVNKCIETGGNTGANDITVRNNICNNFNTGITQIPGSGTGYVADNNLETNVAGLFLDSGNATPTNKNFQLASNRDTGLTLSSFFTTDANGVTRPAGTSAWDRGACEWFGSSEKCPNTSVVGGPPVDVPPSIVINSPTTATSFITTIQNQILQGTSSCGSGSFSSINWVNNQGGSGGVIGTTGWSFTGAGAVLTPYRVNRMTVTLTCTGTSPLTASAIIDIAYNPPELIGAYSFDENSGTAPQDTSGKGNHGSFGAGVAYTTSKQKYGASGLDFSGGSVTIPQNGDANKIVGGWSFVISGVNPDAVHTDFRALIINNYAERLYGQYPGNLTCPAGGMEGSFGSGSTNVSTCVPLPTQPLAIGVNSCVAVTYNGVTLDIYVNKTVVASAARVYELPNVPSGSWQIGNSTFNEPWDGGIDEVRIYNYGISSAQVAIDCDNQIGSAPPAAASSLKIGTVGVKIGDKDVKLGF